MATIREILASEFGRMNGDYRTQKAQAGLLKGIISESEYSYIVRGRRVLSDDRLRKVADKLRPDDSTSAEALFQELRSATRFVRRDLAVSAGTSLDRARGLFQRLSTQDALLCVEFRDFPRAGGSPLTKHPEFLSVAGEAVKSGLHFALFQPFGRLKKSSSADPWPPELRRYLETLRDRVHRDAQDLRQHAISAGLEPAIATKRIVLYERNTDKLDAAGIQARLFYAVLPDDSGGTEHQIWLWAAVAPAEPGGDVFVRLDPDAVSTAAVAAQFAPIIDHWIEKHTLPLNFGKKSVWYVV